MLSTLSPPLLFAFLCFVGRLHAGQIHNTNMLNCTSQVYQPRSSCSPLEPQNVKTEVVYVPLGGSVRLRCRALDITRIEKIPIATAGKNCTAQRSIWDPSLIKDNRSVFWTTTVKDEDAKKTFRLLTNFTLEGIFLQQVHNASFDCHVVTDRFEFISRQRIVMQDCDRNPNVDLRVHRNYRNPCQFGECYIESNKTKRDNSTPDIESLRCKCVEQYTGEFCTEQKEGAIWREIGFHSPLIGYFVGMGILLFLNYLHEKLNAAPRITLRDIVPDPGYPVEDLRLLYPAAYIQLPSEDKPKKPEDDEEKKIAPIEEETSLKRRKMDQKQNEKKPDDDSRTSEGQKKKED